jgi:hypothetical protein
MVVAFYEPFAYDINFERCLEIIESHLAKGDSIHFFGCSKSLKACDTNLYHYSAICNACIKRRKKGLSLLSKPLHYHDLIQLNNAQKAVVESFLKGIKLVDLPSVKAIEFESFDIGTAVMSSVISHLRTPKPDLQKHRKLILNFFRAAIEAYLSMLHHLEDKKIELLYAYNGRFAPMRASIRAAEKLNVNYFTHEIGIDLQKYIVYPNALPHSIKTNQDMIKTYWEATEPQLREANGKAFYQGQESGTLMGGHYDFTKNHQKGLLPSNWDTSKHNIAIFNSSEDEFASIGKEWQGGVYNSQFEGISKIAEALKSNQDIHIYLRMHPNLMNASQSIVKQFDGLNSRNFTIIAPDSSISTYSLLNVAKKVITFSSSVGIEAAYRQKPTIILGRCFYQNLGSTYHPQNHQETLNLLLDKALAAKPITGALMYGHFRYSYGIPYQHYKADTVLKGRFKNQYIDLPLWQQKWVLLFKKIQKLKKTI